MNELPVDPDAAPAHAEELNCKYHELSEEYTRTSNLEKLREALVCIEEAVVQTSDAGKSDALAGLLNNLGRCRRRLFNATGEIAHLDAAIRAGRQSIDAAPETSHLRVLCASSLSDSLAARYFTKDTIDRTDLHDALDTIREALALSSADDPHHEGALSTLASRLGEYNERVEPNDEYMNEAIEIGERLVELESDLKGVHRLNLAVDLKNRFQRYGNVADLHRTKALFEEAIEAFPSGHENHLSAVRQLADCIVLIADRDRKPAMIEEAIEKLSTLDLANASDVQTGKYYHSQAGLHHTKYTASSNLADLDLAVEAENKALSFANGQDLVRSVYLQTLGGYLASHGEIRMDVGTMDLSIRHTQEAVEIALGLPARQSGAYNMLGNRLSSRYNLFGGIENLHEALEARQRALDLLPGDHYERPTRMHNLAITHRDMFEAFPKLESLNESIALERAAYEVLHAKNDPDQAMVLHGLSLSLATRSLRTGNDQDLVESIEASEAAVASCAAGNVLKYTYLNTLANKLMNRGERHRNLDDLDKAVAAISEAAAANTGNYSDELLYLVTKSNCLAARHGLTGSLDDLNQSLRSAERAVEMTPKDHPSRLGYLHNIGMRLERKYDLETSQAERRDFLQRAHDIELEVTNELPEDHPDMPIYLPFLAKRQLNLATFMDISNEEALMDQLRVAAETFTRAFKKTYAAPVNRINNGNMAGYCWMGLKEWAAASKILTETVRMFRLASPMSLDEPDRQRQLRGLSGISTLACTSCIALNRPEAALEVLEAGRGIMANIAMGYHADFTEIKEADQTLHDRYVELRDSISQAMPDSSSTHAADFVRIREEELAEMEWVAEQIRALPGLGDFQRGLTAKDMKALASQGPIVSLCTTDHRCDAIIATQNEIQVLPLPDLSNADVQKRVPLVVGPSRLSTLSPSQFPLANKKMRSLLSWLWQKVVHPVLAHLDLLCAETSHTPLPRLWWLTSGPLGLLPLHAAGKGARHPTSNAYAHVVSSYTPSFSALSFARRCQASVYPTFAKAALITMPATPGLNDLSTHNESASIRAAFTPTTRELTELVQPTAAQVLHTIHSTDTNILHLACHASPSLSDPSATALLFGSPSSSSPDPLPVRSLRAYRGPNGYLKGAMRLAYLSACCTAQQYDLRLADENIHLAATFLTLGFAGVVGTLWEADDGAAVVVARGFYEELFRLDGKEGRGEGEGGREARALHAAVEACRKREVGRGDAAADVLAWASFVHVGA